MNLFQAIGIRSKSNAINSDHLPIENDFVDVFAGGKTETVCIESVSKAGIETRRPPKAVLGQPALFNYSNKLGRFRFQTECTKISGACATFALPLEITVIEQLGEKRKNFRLNKLLNVQWRYAPDGVGNGPFVKGTVRNLSSTGACLDVGRELRKGTLVEIQLDPVLLGKRPVIAIAELARPAQKDSKGVISAGVCFQGIGMTGQNAIAEFIHTFEKNDKERHLAR